MKKTVIICVLATALMATNNTKKSSIDFNEIKDQETKVFLMSLDETLPSVFEVVKDYYEAKTCRNDFYNVINARDVKKFVTEKHFGTLYELVNIKEAKRKYKEIISDYRFMNCGEGSFNKIPDLNNLNKTRKQ